MVLNIYVLILLLYGLNTSFACHSLSSQYSQFSSRRARARGVSSLQRTSENAIDFDYLTSNLPYSATEIRSISSLTPFPVKPMLTVSDGGKLTCHFDDDMEYCGWHNAADTDMKFWKSKLNSDNNFDSQRFDSGSPLSFTPDNNFLLAGGEPMILPQTAAIEMEIPCQYGDAEVKFDFWTNTLNVLVRYCISKVAADFTQCQIIPRASNPINFSIPTTADGLKVRIEVTNIDPDSIALIDNLHYNGQICELVDEAIEQSVEPFPEDTNSSSTVPSLITGDPLPTDPTIQKFFEEDGNGLEDNDASSAITVQKITSTASSILESSQVNVKELSSCSALTCTFNDGDSCFFGLSGVGSTAAWSLSDRLVGNRHTGIQRVNLDDQSKIGFAYVGSDSKSESENIFVAESPKFSLSHDSYLIFDVYIRSVSPKLKVCIDNFENCPYNSPQLRKDAFWRGEQKLILKEGSRKIFFVAENVKKHQFLAIDNIRLEGKDGASLC
ncbi:MAM domain-containing protein [Caenorhabditis elegans]|uniref:MAM domain-containing protein n=1 Tax=Caenorhabditis elegans TaxID=6239 RepID=Q4R133_CAEEL|nr:MAM domain-containing protein [Caenorhabditis elegans]CCD65123.2 MAM domain-containing protein [Caenorhabditis elegans]|eukprot:NP_001343627.1 Uncharacterized protein CELE_CD4.11 [Caenorhabditis elegans]